MTPLDTLLEEVHTTLYIQSSSLPWPGDYSELRMVMEEEPDPDEGWAHIPVPWGVIRGRRNDVLLELWKPDVDALVPSVGTEPTFQEAASVLREEVWALALRRFDSGAGLHRLPFTWLEGQNPAQRVVIPAQVGRIDGAVIRWGFRRIHVDEDWDSDVFVWYKWDFYEILRKR